MGDTSVTVDEMFLKEKKNLLSKNTNVVHHSVSYQQAVLVPNLSSFYLVFFSCVCHFQVSSLENLLAAYNDAAGIKENFEDISII